MAFFGDRRGRAVAYGTCIRLGRNPGPLASRIARRFGRHSVVEHAWGLC